MEGPEGARTERFSRVLVSVGRRPNSAGLGLENTQVELDGRGFVHDRPPAAHGRSAHPRPSATWPANRCSRTRPRTKARSPSRSCSASRPQFDALAIPAVVFTDPEIAWAGLTEERGQARESRRRSRPLSLGRQRSRQALGPHRRLDQAADRRRKRTDSGRRHRRRQRGRPDLPRPCWRSKWVARSATWPSRSTRTPRSARRSARRAKCIWAWRPKSTGPAASRNGRNSR